VASSGAKWATPGQPVMMRRRRIGMRRTSETRMRIAISTRGASHGRGIVVTLTHASAFLGVISFVAIYLSHCIHESPTRHLSGLP
jgi:hypothetical protein